MAVTYEQAKTHLKTLVAALPLAELQSRALEAIALDDYGFQLSAAPSILAASINCPVADCSHLLTVLMGAGFLLTVATDSHTRVVANYTKLGISEEYRQALRQGRPTPFEQLDAPHSAEAMATLHALFLEETRPIYLGLDITAPTVFEKLAERSRKGLMTVFVMPHRSLIPPERHAHYNEIRRQWVTFVRELPASARRNIRLRISKRSYRYLHTSALTADYVRFNCYWYEQRTTRSGTMVKAQKGSSLYELVYREYAEAVANASPIASLWPAEWLQHVSLRFAPILIVSTLLVAAYVSEAIAETGLRFAAFVATFLAGLAGEALWTSFRDNVRTPPELYES
jgi:hypothetical protein